MKRSIKIGLCGLGTVGAGVAELLQTNSEIIRDRVGAEINVVKAATLASYDHLAVDFSDIVVTDSVEEILSDPDIDIVVELIGGTGIAQKIILDAFSRGKSVVTANKALLAEFSEPLFRAAYQTKGLFGFEASVAGGIPIIRSVREGFRGDRIDSISGIVNGTANFILTSMGEEKTNFDVALKLAQEKGFAEADPTFDIEGIDSAHKLIILMQLAYNTFFDFGQVYVEGISAVEAIDLEMAEKMGYQIKLLAKSRRVGNEFEGRVHPALVKKSHMLATVKGAFNAVEVVGNFVGQTLSYGAGAGSHPTASAVVSDVIEISRFLIDGKRETPLPLSVELETIEKKPILPIDEVTMEYYLRFTCDTQSGHQSQLVSLLEKNGVRIQSLTSQQTHDNSPPHLSVVIRTEKTMEKDLRSAINIIDASPLIKHPTMSIRFEE